MVTLQWAAPASTGSGLAYYVVRTTQSGVGPWYVPLNGTANFPITFPIPETLSTAQTLSVTAANAAGESAPATTPSVTPTARTAPLPPAYVFASSGSTTGSAVVSWGSPLATGGSAITGYTVTASPGGQQVSVSGNTTFSATFTGLTLGVSYTFAVATTNAVGTSAQSVSSPAITLPSLTINGQVLAAGTPVSPLSGQVVFATCAEAASVSGPTVLSQAMAKPNAGRISPHSVTSSSCYWDSSKAPTDASGDFSLPVAADKYDLVVANPTLGGGGFNSTSTTVVDATAGLPISGITLQASPATAIVNGAFTLPDGSPVASWNMNVWITGQSGPSVPVVVGYTSGTVPSYAATLAPGGSYLIQVYGYTNTARFGAQFCLPVTGNVSHPLTLALLGGASSTTSLPTSSGLCPLPGSGTTITTTTSGGGGSSSPAPSAAPSTAAVGTSGAPIVTAGTTTASGGATVLGTAAAGTGVADIPTNIVLPTTFTRAQHDAGYDHPACDAAHRSSVADR
jgi:hypothetical protein